SVMKAMPVSHSAGVRFTSRAKACRCLTAASMISRSRASGVVAIWSSTAWVTVVSFRSCMASSLEILVGFLGSLLSGPASVLCRPSSVVRAPSSRFLRYRVAQRADAADVDFDDITGFHPHRRLAIGADPAGGARDDHVAGFQHGECGAIADQSWD